MGRASLARIGFTALVAASALAGCGRKGPLEPPPGLPQTQTPTQAQTAQASALQNLDDPGLLQSPDIVYEQSAIAKLNSATRNPARPINAPPVAQPSTFVLDPLVK